MQAQMLAPAAALVAWTLIMLVWTAATRLPALSKIGGLKNAKAVLEEFRAEAAKAN